MREYIKINPKDNVAVALCPLEVGREIRLGDTELTLRDNIAQGHKFAMEEIKAGNSVRKYGSVIGTATEDIPAGSWVHLHNVRTNLAETQKYEYRRKEIPAQPHRTCSFMGYKRGDGKFGVRNEIWIVPTVGCVNSIAETLARSNSYLAEGSIDAVVAFTHPYGCSQMGEDQESTRRLLADLIHHPNAGGVLVLGLGCENSNISVLKEYIGEYDAQRVKFLACQSVDDEIAEGSRLLKELADCASRDTREEADCSALVIGVKCGGSDGLSGITANPAVGIFMDKIIACGGTGILTEVPEMFGAETLLMERCADKECFNKTVALINDFKDYFTRNDQTVYENPSPGNKAGGITTLEDKSLGCIQKSGSTPVVDVLGYGERVKKRGLNLLSGPGNDLVSSTALAASGAQIVLFTTGRGTPFASPVPTIKISTNSELAKRKHTWIDFNSGTVAEDEELEANAERLFQLVIRVASGEKVRSEIAGYHAMAIFKRGVTL